MSSPRVVSSSTWCVVVCELRQWEQVRPVVLLVVAVDPEVLFKCLVGSLCLAIALRVVTRGEVEAHVEGFSE